MGKKATKTKEVKPRKTREKKQTDKNKVKRPISAYFYFLQDRRLNYKVNHPEISNKEFIIMMGKQWKELSDEERTQYEKLAIEDKKRFEKEKKGGSRKGSDVKNSLKESPEKKPHDGNGKEESEEAQDQQNGSNEDISNEEN